MTTMKAWMTRSPDGLVGSLQTLAKLESAVESSTVFSSDVTLKYLQKLFLAPDVSEASSDLDNV